MYNDLISVSADEIKRGYIYNKEMQVFECIVCGKEFPAREIYKIGERYHKADAAVHDHIKEEHGGMLDVLMSGVKSETGLTDNQKQLLRLISEGRSDRETADIMGVSASTVRHQKFVFRQKVRQAKMLVAVYELTQEGALREKAGDTPVPIHKNAKMVDERYNITESEREKILRSVFTSLDPLKLKIFSAKEKKKLVALARIAECFEYGRTYTEKEINSILESVFQDYVTLRRYLIEYGFLDRRTDCSLYWKTGT